MSLFQLMYSSQASEELRFEDVCAIRDRASDLNNQCFVTGFLVFGFGKFLQVLEGERSVVSEIYRRVSSDKRHSQLELIQFTEIEAREFPDWGMNLIGIGESNRQEIEALLSRLGCPMNLETRRMTPRQCSMFLQYLAARHRELTASPPLANAVSP